MSKAKKNKTTTQNISNEEIFNTKSFMNKKMDIKNRIGVYENLLRNIRALLIKEPELAHKYTYLKLDDKSLFRINIATFYINMIMWKPYVFFEEPIIEEDIYDFHEANKNTYIYNFDKLIKKFINKNHELDKTRFIADIKEQLIEILNIYAIFVSNTYSLFDIMSLESRNKRFAQLFYTELDDKVTSVHDMETFLTESKKEIVNIIKDDSQSAMYPYVTSNILNATQLVQMNVSVGPRSDIDKTIIPKPISRNYTRGLKNLSEFYVEAISTRNSMIIKKKHVPESGYLSSKINILCLSTEIDQRIFDCGTNHYVDYLVKTNEHLKILEGKYRVDEATNQLVPIHSTDEFLIGTWVKFRSHTKCITAHDHNKVCCVCAGEKYKTMRGTRIGGLVSIGFINRISSLAMSAKHQTATKSEEIEHPIIQQYFNVQSSMLYKRTDIDGKHIEIILPIEAIDDIISAQEEMSESVGNDEGINFSSTLENVMIKDGSLLNVIDTSSKTFSLGLSGAIVDLVIKGKYHTFDYESVNDEYVVDGNSTEEDDEDSILLKIDPNDDFVSIKFKDISAGMPIFTTHILTEEVSVYLKLTKNAIGANTPFYNDVETPMNELVDIIIRSGIGSDGQMFHIETILLNLMRAQGDAINHPDYSQDIEPSVMFLKLDQAIKKSSFFSGLIFQRIGAQLEDPDTMRKHTSSVYDILFKNSRMLHDRGLSANIKN